MNPDIALDTAKALFRVIQPIPGGFAYGFESLANGELMLSETFPTKSKAVYARYKSILEVAVSFCDDGARAYETRYHAWPWRMQRAFLGLHADATGKSPYRRKKWSPARRRAHEDRVARELAEWKSRRQADRAKPLRRFGAVHHTHDAAMVEARRRIVVTRPHLSPDAVDKLARWLAGAP